MLDFRDPDRFTTGTVGDPGARVFYLQAVEDSRVTTLRLEKQQVQALADSLAGILADLAEPDEPRPSQLDLVEPVEAEWVVGAMGVAYDEPADRILIAAQELDPDADEDDEEDAENLATARFFLTRSQALAFVDHARDVVAAGRPTCRFCGQPRDPATHVCPRMN